MRIILMFDLPMESSADRRAYNKFRKDIMNQGFIMVQKSIYCKLSLNASATDIVLKNVRSIKPSNGLIQILTITENQYQKMENILGDSTSNIIESTERFLVL